MDRTQVRKIGTQKDIERLGRLETIRIEIKKVKTGKTSKAAKDKKRFVCLSGDFSSCELKGQLGFSDRNLCVVRRHRCCCRRRYLNFS